MKLIINVFMVIFLVTAVGYTQTFLNITADNGDSFRAVLVEKNGKWLHLLEVGGGTVKVIDSFQVLTGRANGDKIVQGDEKTPEGLYFVTGFLSPEKLKSMYGDVAKQYGSGAYPLSYPNIKDRLDRKTGGGIWLHGVDPVRAEDVTKGCVAFGNDKLEMLADFIGVGTPVLITDEGMQGSPDELAELFRNAKSAVLDFIKAWDENDFEKFKSHYNSDFKAANGSSLSSYLAYKKNLMQVYPYRKVYADNFRIFIQNKNEAVAEFDQFYCAPNVVSYGKKRYYMEKEDGELKFTAEEFIQSDASGQIRTMVADFLTEWKKAWESLDIEKYMAFYSENFSVKGMDFSGWKNDKSGKFEKLKNVSVDIDKIEFTNHSPMNYSIEFRQKYSGDEYSDTGIKTLRVAGCPGDFKIVTEHWRAE